MIGLNIWWKMSLLGLLLRKFKRIMYTWGGIMASSRDVRLEGGNFSTRRAYYFFCV